MDARTAFEKDGLVDKQKALAARALIAVVDGRKGFPYGIRAVLPEATVQTCIVHLHRSSLDFVSWKARKVVAGALKDISGLWTTGRRRRL